MSEEQFERVSVFSAENRVEVPVYPLDVFVVTEAGEAELKGDATRLPAAALEVLVALDGKATVGDVEQKLPPVPPLDVRNIIRSLLAARFIRPATVGETEGFDFDAMLREADRPLSDGVHASAHLESEPGAEHLSNHGYYVSIARAALPGTAPVNGSHRDLLYVEDDPDMAALVRHMLEEQGFAVEVVATRAEVQARLRRLPMPDLVLMDVNLPDVNGFEILRLMKLHPKLKSVPVIMVTAEATREAVMKGLANGADGYLTKPFRRERLLGGVKAVLGL